MRLLTWFLVELCETILQKLDLFSDDPLQTASDLFNSYPSHHLFVFDIRVKLFK